MSQPPLNQNPDPRLAELIEHAVADVDPADRLATIRSRTAHASESKVTIMTSRRSWTITAGAAVAAAAAVVVAVAVIGQQNSKPTSGPGPAASDSSSQSTSGGSSPSSPSTSTTAPASTFTVPAYYLGDTPQGVRLYREFHPLSGAANDPLAEALTALTDTPADPDYRTPWPADAFSGATYDGDVITVTLADTSLRDRPASMDEATARMAVQQVIFTVQAAVQKRAPVQFRSPDNPIDQVLGVPTAEPLANDDPNDVLSLVSLSDPGEGLKVTGGTLKVSGVANSFEATVPWQILQGTEVVDEYSFMAEGAYDKLYPFSGTIDVSGLAPGTYTLRVATDDPSGGEGPGPFVDTRTFVIG
jgi:hypothetical protein